MLLSRRCRPQLAVAVLLTALTLGGCGYAPDRTLNSSATTEKSAAGHSKKIQKAKKHSERKLHADNHDSGAHSILFSEEIVASANERDCLVRAMYFESQRTSREGLLAVGTVVMNRLNSPSYPNTICGVVGQRRQFAPGVLSRPMSDRERKHAEIVADEVIAGKRHADIRDAMFFHVASRRYKYSNMQYLQVAGGNIFYRKTGPNAPRVVEGSALAYAASTPSVDVENLTDTPATDPLSAIFQMAMAPLKALSTEQKTARMEEERKMALQEAAITTAIVAVPHSTKGRVSLTASVDAVLSRAQSFSKKPLMPGSYRTAGL